MKRKSYVMLVATLMFALLQSCEPNSGRTSEKVKTISATEVTTTSALLTGEVSVEIADYKSMSFGILISDKESDLLSYEGSYITGRNLIGKSFSVEATKLSMGTKYYYRAYLILNGMQEEYGKIKSFVTENVDDKAPNTITKVNLGLSVLWANCNIGASAPQEYGDYFAWGETKTKKDYSWSTYKHCHGDANTLTKYCIQSIYGTVDNQINLAPQDDASYVKWGSVWRMPTDAEWTELREQCTWKWTEQKGIKGYQVIGKNGNSIFLPVTGYSQGTKLNDINTHGQYWSSSLYTSNSHCAFHIIFSAAQVKIDWTNGLRYYGLPIRPVCNK